MNVQQVIAGERRWGVAVGDCTESMRAMPAGCVQMCVTSPPYYGLRSYLPKGHPDKAKEIGTEETPEAYIARMVGVFAEVKRVLRSDGVLWVNIGDSYASSGGHTSQGETSQRAGRSNVEAQHAVKGFKGGGCYKPKDRIGIPHMLAFALRADGWYFRDEIIWHKPNPMPSSTTDRTTAAHEFVFMFSKSARYYYDGLAIAEKATRGGDVAGGKKYQGGDKLFIKHSPSLAGLVADTRNKRSVWRVSTRPYKGSHYATYPPKLIEPCILAGTSAKGCCPKCGAPWVRVVDRKRVATRPGDGSKVFSPKDSAKIDAGLISKKTGLHQPGWRKAAAEVGNRDPQRHVTSVETTGWQPSCECGEAETVGCVVLDPFVGSGTTLQVANEHGRRAIGCDLDERNLTLIAGRMATITPQLAFGE